MAYITKEKASMNKDERNKVSIDKDLFAFASDFQDVYFANDLNWKKIAVHFRHATSNQRKIIVLLSEAEEGHFEVSSMARTGSWLIDQIQVFDKDGGMESIGRSGIPEAGDIDIQVLRKIAPSEIITNISSTNSVLTNYIAAQDADGSIQSMDQVTINFNSGWEPGATFAITGGVAFASQAGAGGRISFEELQNGDWIETDVWNSTSDGNYFKNITVNGITSAVRLVIKNQDSMNGMIFGSFIANAMSAAAQILSVAAGKTLNFEVGYRVRIWDEVAMAYHDAFVYTITAVVGDTITLDDPIANHTGKTLRLKFPSYADASARQKGIFQFIGSLF